MHICFGFNLCASEDTTPLKFGGVMLLCTVFMSACVCVVCYVKLRYLLFVYGFENLMKIN